MSDCVGLKQKAVINAEVRGHCQKYSNSSGKEFLILVFLVSLPTLTLLLGFFIIFPLIPYVSALSISF